MRLVLVCFHRSYNINKLVEQAVGEVLRIGMWKPTFLKTQVHMIIGVLKSVCKYNYSWKFETINDLERTCLLH